MTELITQCQCRNIGDDDPLWGCGNQMTQEDLLCDTCRDGCNAGIKGNDGTLGYHFRASGMRLEWCRDGHWTDRFQIRTTGTL